LNLENLIQNKKRADFFNLMWSWWSTSWCSTSACVRWLYINVIERHDKNSLEIILSWGMLGFPFSNVSSQLYSIYSNWYANKFDTLFYFFCMFHSSAATCLLVEPIARGKSGWRLFSMVKRPWKVLKECVLTLII